MTDLAFKRIQRFEDIEPGTGSYWKGADGSWWLYHPHIGALSIARHTVEEHEDGTITVQPSILLTGHDGGQEITRHGYITRGVWRDT